MRERRRRAEAKAKTQFDKAEQDHLSREKTINREREAIEKRAEAETARWEELKDRLESAVRKARASA
jgi:hypothetical protein